MFSLKSIINNHHCIYLFPAALNVGILNLSVTKRANQMAERETIRIMSLNIMCIILLTCGIILAVYYGLQSFDKFEYFIAVTFQYACNGTSILMELIFLFSTPMLPRSEQNPKLERRMSRNYSKMSRSTSVCAHSQCAPLMQRQNSSVSDNSNSKDAKEPPNPSRSKKNSLAVPTPV